MVLRFVKNESGVQDSSRSSSSETAQVQAPAHAPVQAQVNTETPAENGQSPGSMITSRPRTVFTFARVNHVRAERSDLSFWTNVLTPQPSHQQTPNVQSAHERAALHRRCRDVGSEWSSTTCIVHPLDKGLKPGDKGATRTLVVPIQESEKNDRNSRKSSSLPGLLRPDSMGSP